jgi:hypothetical protein
VHLVDGENYLKMKRDHGMGLQNKKNWLIEKHFLNIDIVHVELLFLLLPLLMLVLLLLLLKLSFLSLLFLL